MQLVPRTSRPPIGTPLDRSSSLTTGLFYFAPFWEQNAKVVRDVVQHNDAGTIAGSPVWASGRAGSSLGGLSCPASASIKSGTIPAGQQSALVWPMTVVFGATVVTTQTATTMFGLYSGTAAIITLQGGTTSGIGYAYLNGSSSVANNQSNNITLGTNVVAGVTITGTSQSLYINGNLKASASNTAANPTLGSPVWFIGGGSTQSVLFYWAAGWTRALTASEHAELAINPWQIFAPTQWAILQSGRAYTSVMSGNWSSSSTWTPTPPAGHPGNNDTVTLANNVTVDVNTTVGTSGATGTAAVTWSSAPASGVSLTVADGVTFTVRGDLMLNCAYYPGQGSPAPGLLAIGTGSTGGAKVIMDPPSGAQYKVDCSQERCLVSLTGVTGNHASLSTSARGGSNSYINVSAGLNRDQGVLSASYADITNIGTASVVGVNTQLEYPTSGTASLTHLTLTGSSYFANFESSWDGNFTFQNNKLVSSTTTTIGGVTACAGFAWDINPSSGTRLIDSCSFDGPIGNGAFRGCTFSNIVLGGGIFNGSGSNWTSASQFNNVFVSSGSAGSATPFINIMGPIGNVYLFNAETSNPHYLSIDNSAASLSITGCIFETAATTGDGDCIFPPTSTGATTLSVTNCIGIPTGGGSGATCGNFLSCLQSATSTVTITCEHNTWPAKSADGGLIGLTETTNSYAAEITSCRANIIWDGTASEANSYAVSRKGVATMATDCVTVAGYNGFYNPESSPASGTNEMFYNTSTGQTGVVGYGGLKSSVNHVFPNTAIGTGDFTANPTFVDNTRCLSTWGGTATGGGVATNAGALATLAANPALIAQASTGLLAWVRAGWRPTNTAYENTSYSGDASTADAAGNAWPGGGPGVGAMAVSVVATYQPWIFGDQIQEMYG